MPRGPKGEKRPAGVIGNAVHVMRIATGEVDETPSHNEGQRAGGRARAEKLTAAERRAIAQKASASRWKKEA
jgi:hypothetical protein